MRRRGGNRKWTKREGQRRKRMGGSIVMDEADALPFSCSTGKLPN